MLCKKNHRATSISALLSFGECNSHIKHSLNPHPLLPLSCFFYHLRYSVSFVILTPPPSTQAYKAVGESTEIPLTYYHNNVSATIFLLQIMSDFDCTKFVYSSSATVYGTPPVIPIPETTRLQADSPYGKSKVMSETLLEDLTHGLHYSKYLVDRWRRILIHSSASYS